MKTAGANCKADPNTILHQQVGAEFMEKANDVLAALATIHPAVHWVPGNHDPDHFFDATHYDVGGSAGTNVHARVEMLAPNLWIAGWGGCVEATEDGKAVWGAYPYAEAELPARIEVLKVELAAKVTPGDSVVLMTHAGPSASSTSVVSGTDPDSLLVPGVRGVGEPEAAGAGAGAGTGAGAEKGSGRGDGRTSSKTKRAMSQWIQTGSETISELLFEQAQQKSVLFHVHGHTHNGCGRCQVGSVPVINPGSLRYTGTFAIVRLKKLRGAWVLTSTEVRCLDHVDGEARSQGRKRKGPE